jgi:hypothetical protein
MTQRDIEANDRINPIRTLEVLEAHKPDRFKVEGLGK